VAELGPARSRRRSQAAQGGFGVLEPSLQGRRLAVGQRRGADDLHPLTPGVCGLAHHGGLRPLELVSDTDEFVVDPNRDQLRRLVTGQSRLHPSRELSRDRPRQGEPGQVEILRTDNASLIFFRQRIA
jgi:hypothetical protein